MATINPDGSKTLRITGTMGGTNYQLVVSRELGLGWTVVHQEQQGDFLELTFVPSKQADPVT